MRDLNKQNVLLSELGTQEGSPETSKQIKKGAGNDRVRCGIWSRFRRRNRMERQRSATLGNQLTWGNRWNARDTEKLGRTGNEKTGTHRLYTQDDEGQVKANADNQQGKEHTQGQGVR